MKHFHPHKPFCSSFSSHPSWNHLFEQQFCMNMLAIPIPQQLFSCMRLVVCFVWFLIFFHHMAQCSKHIANAIVLYDCSIIEIFMYTFGGVFGSVCVGLLGYFYWNHLQKHSTGMLREKVNRNFGMGSMGLKKNNKLFVFANKKKSVGNVYWGIIWELG